ncbi:MAG: efflux RND transporter periplasmic adaptor subunit [Nitrosomonas sp.]|nr:efflux RND transporter periplasmic adaptor subunit [Nitrosomonas sp.]
MKFILNITGILLLVTLFLVGCGNSEKTNNASSQNNSTDSADLNKITLSPEMANRIKVDQLQLVELTARLQVPSQIKVDEQKLIRIGANVTGRIVEVNAQLGDEVDAGTILARISSPQLTKAQLAYLRAHSHTELNARAAKRAKLLLEADVIGSAELQRREAELQVSRAELSAAQDQLRLLGVTESAVQDLEKNGNILPSVAITVSDSGTVIERNVLAGQVVQPSDRLFKVADLSSVWAIGDVPEQNARNVMEGQHVEIHVPALGNAVFAGQIVFVADTVNPVTRTVTVRTVVQNPERLLKPAMLATMHITENPQLYLAVPEKAVVRESNQDYVFIAESNNNFLRVPVELDHTINKLRPVLDGLTVGQSIVVEGAFHLDNERKLAELE